MATAAAFYDHNPYPGPRSFSRKERAVFRGRDYESRELFSLVVAHKIVLLYSQSGAGKTSLLNAGLTPLLQEEGFQVFPVARVAGGIPGALNVESVPNPYALNVLLSWSEQDGGLEPKQLASISLNQFLQRNRSSQGADRRDSVRVLLFDQFEELFTCYPERWKERAEFVDQLAEALRADDYLRVVLGMREEYLGPLDVYAHALPESMDTRFRLERLGKEDALAAVVEPLKITRRHFAPDVAEKLVEDLLKIKVVSDHETTLEAVGEYVEPVQLQVVCSGLWDKLPAETQEITFEYLQDFGDVTDALSGFYEESIKETAQKAGVTEGRLRKWFEQTLLTPAGTRGTVFRGAAETGGLPNAAVDILQAKHIIRCDSRAGSAWYELTHDRFIDPILKSNARWREKHGDLEKLRVRFEAKAEHWDQTGRPVAELLKETELREARLWLENPDAVDLGCSERVHAWISASAAEVQQRQERQHYLEAQAQIAKRLRVVAASLFVALLFAVGAGWFALKKMNDANQKSDAARKSAEALRIQGLRERKESVGVVANEISLLDSLIKKSSLSEAAPWRSQKATLLIEQEKLDDAIEEAKEAIDVAPGYEDARTSRGYARMLQKRPQDALTDLEYIRDKINPKEAINYLNLTVAYSQLGRGADASQSLGKAIFYSLHGQNYGGSEGMVPPEVTIATGRSTLTYNGEVFRQALYFMTPVLDAYFGQGDISSDLQAAKAHVKQDGIRPSETADAGLVALTWEWFLKGLNRPDYSLLAVQGALWEESDYPKHASELFAAFLKAHDVNKEARYDRLADWVRKQMSTLGNVEFSFSKEDPAELQVESELRTAQGKYPEAKRLVTAAIGQEKNRIDLYYERLDILDQMAREERSKENNDQAQQLYTEMMEDCNQVLRLNKDAPNAYLYRAIANSYRTDPNWQQVISDLEHAIELDPASESAIASLGNLTADTSPERAAQLYEKYMSLSPGANPDVLEKLATLQIQLKQFADAFDTIQKAIALDPANPSYQQTLAEAKKGLGSR
jgi:tetratricopeptide (TPR) repeat protein